LLHIFDLFNVSAIYSQIEVELKTAPADFRFPTTNQTRHCFTRYVEFHKSLAAKGEESGACEKFAKYYRSLCPGDWVSSLALQLAKTFLNCALIKYQNLWQHF
ncbi:cytochrome c oxidase subunit 6b-2, partial [Quercus suber]